MNHEIKFRAWNAYAKTMYEVDLLHIRNSKPQQPTHLEGNYMSLVYQPKVVLMQYTGRKDKSINEVDIYEGDLFGKSDSVGVEVFGEVYFDTDFAGFCVRYPSGGWTTLGEHLLGKQNHREIIGNIYENGDLLK